MFMADKRSKHVNQQLRKSLRKLLAFTLIEVLLALSIFSMAGIALLSTADSHFNNLSILENKMYADWIAADQLVSVNLEQTWPPKNNKKGTTTLAGREWHWLQKVIKTTDNDMRAVVIEIRMEEKDKLALTSLMTYVSKGTGK